MFSIKVTFLSITVDIYQTLPENPSPWDTVFSKVRGTYVLHLFELRSVITGLAKDLIGKVDSLAFLPSDTSKTDLPTSTVGAILVRN